jgi:LysM repeat protein
VGVDVTPVTPEERRNRQMAIQNVGNKSAQSVQSVAAEHARPPEGAVYQHTVKKGETLGGLADRFFGSRDYVDLLKNENNIKDANKISIGQKLVIPTVVNYYVKPGENLTQIARDMWMGDDPTPSDIKAMTDALAQMNNLKDPNKLQVGQLLAVPLH